MLTKRYLFLALIGLGSLTPASAQTTIFNCSSFSSAGTCNVAPSYPPPSTSFWVRSGGNLSGSQIDFVPTGSTHNGYGLWYVGPENIQSFSTTFTFVPNGWNFAFVLQNDNTHPGYEGNTFSSGASCEAGFYQDDGTDPAPNNLFALDFDSSGTSGYSSSFTFSMVQVYQQHQSPCNPNDGGAHWYATNKISTSPVPLNSPVGTQFSTTGDTYSATVTYDGNNVVLSMYDMTAGGSCPGASCFSHTWQVGSIPSLVNGNTSYIGFTSGVGSGSPQEPTQFPLYVKSWSYTVNAPTANPSLTAWNAGTTTNNGTVSAASPIYSIAPGTYSSTQSVSLSTSTSGAYICYTLAASTPTFYPQPDNNGGCAQGTLYSGPVSVSSSTTLYAMAGTNWGTGPPSSLVAGVYTITGGGSAATPTFSPAAGTYSSAQSVAISDATSGATIYYTTDGTTPTTFSTVYASPIAVNSTRTLEAIAVAAGYTNSAVASATYTITATPSLPAVSTPTFSPGGGAYTSARRVTISDATSDATIYYTTDGTAPGMSSAEYTGPITVSSTETLEAIAAATGYTDSTVASAAYTITSSVPSVATPTFSPAAGSYSSAQAVTISDATSDATIYYTTDGTTPTTTSTKYTGAITVSSTETLEAIAVATGDSAVASAAYTINSQPNFVLGTSTASLSVNPGGTGKVTLTVTPVNGFDSPVILACSALPTWATCSFDQATVTPSSGAATTQLTISTSAQSSTLQPGSRPFVPLTALAMTVCLFGRRNRRRWHYRLLLAVAYTGLGLLGCGGTNGGGGSSATPTSKSTTSTVMVTAISGTLQGTATITLTVN